MVFFVIMYKELLLNTFMFHLFTCIEIGKSRKRKTRAKSISYSIVDNFSRGNSSCMSVDTAEHTA